MRRKAAWVLVPLIAVLATLLFGCRPITYYLSQVYKVYGRVTVAGSAEATPIGSAEVFVGNYQYSELTNYYGDYEMELAEGTWTIRIEKEGYEPFSATVTVGPDPAPRRVRLDAQLVWIEPVVPLDLTGYWDLTLYPAGGDPFPVGAFYIRQEDTTLYARGGGDSPYLVGSLTGPTFTLEAPGMTMNGTVSESGDQISGTFTTTFMGSGTFDMGPYPDVFGHLELSGSCGGIPVSVNTEYGQGFSEVSTWQLANFDVTLAFSPTETVQGSIGLSGMLLSEGHFDISPEEEGGNDELRASLWLPYPPPDDNVHATDGSFIDITQYNSPYTVGSFSLNFSDGSHIEGTFNLDFTGMTGTTTVSSGNWQGRDLVPYTNYYAYAQSEVRTDGNFVLEYWNDQFYVWIWFNLKGVPSANYYVVAINDLAGAWGNVSAWTVDGLRADSVDMESGWLNISSFGASGAEGSFSIGLQGGGILTGSFQLPVQALIH